MIISYKMPKHKTDSKHKHKHKPKLNYTSKTPDASWKSTVIELIDVKNVRQHPVVVRQQISSVQIEKTSADCWKYLIAKTMIRHIIWIDVHKWIRQVRTWKWSYINDETETHHLLFYIQYETDGKYLFRMKEEVTALNELNVRQTHKAEVVQLFDSRRRIQTLIGFYCFTRGLCSLIESRINVFLLLDMR